MSPSELAAPLPLSPAPSLVVDDSPGFQPADTRLNPPSDTVSPPPPSPCQEPLVPLDSATPSLPDYQAETPSHQGSDTLSPECTSPSPCVGRRLPFSPSSPSESSVPRAQKRVAHMREADESALERCSFHNNRAGFPSSRTIISTARSGVPSPFPRASQALRFLERKTRAVRPSRSRFLRKQVLRAVPKRTRCIPSPTIFRSAAIPRSFQRVVAKIAPQYQQAQSPASSVCVCPPSFTAQRGGERNRVVSRRAKVG